MSLAYQKHSLCKPSKPIKINKWLFTEGNKMGTLMKNSLTGKLEVRNKGTYQMCSVVENKGEYNAC